MLRSYLKAAQDDISILLEEKKALLDTIRSLQVTPARVILISHLRIFLTVPLSLSLTLLIVMFTF